MSSPASGTAPSSVRLACASPAFVEGATATEIDDWLSYFDPALVVLTGDDPAPRAANAVRRHLDGGTELFDPAGENHGGGPRAIDGVQFVFAPHFEALAGVREYETGALDPEQPTYVLTDLLELDVDTTALSTTLVGREQYVSTLDPTSLDGRYIHVSTGLPIDYRREWDGLPVVGGGSGAGTGGTGLVALDCRNDGRVLCRELRRDSLGLRALDGVGSKRARTLREAGYTSREAISTADLSALADLQGLGKSTAERIRGSARAIDRGEIVRESEAALPNRDPVYIDIETDGLNPTVTWLVGVLDGSAGDGNYMAFLGTDPEDPGRAIADFMSWYTANASHRPLVAYNGWAFDFPTIHDHIVEYCPQYEDDWTSSYRFDPYRWVVEEDNAILPGRTNKLEDVAGALGYERTESGLTGAAVARTYRRWIEDSRHSDETAEMSSASEPDWERFERYCEDDVRALAVVYEALEASGRIVSTDTDARDTAETTTQGTLSDW